jgi:hypothetical protein
MRYRKKPLEVEAVQWRPGILVAGAAMAELGDGPFGSPGSYFRLQTVEGVMTGQEGDWIVGPGAAGEYWIVRDDIFRLTYEPA